MTVADAELRPGSGEQVRREYRMRAVAAVVIGLLFLAIGVYGAVGTAGSGDSGVPFLVAGLAGALAQLVLVIAFRSARRAITGDRYDRPAVTRARKSVSAVLALLAAGVVVGFIAGLSALGGGLAGLMAGGLIAAFALTAEGWRHLRHLG
jgi:hypothetical protein